MLYNDLSPKYEEDEEEEEEEEDYGERSTDMLNAPVCRFKVTSSPSPSNDNNSPKFPPAISVIVDPPSPSTSVKSKHDDFGFGQLGSFIRRYSGGSMERRKLFEKFYISNKTFNQGSWYI